MEPKKVTFSSLANKLLQFRLSLCFYERVSGFIDKLDNISINLDQSKIDQFPNQTISATEIWLESMKKFMEDLENNYVTTFPDVVYLVLNGHCQLRHGIEILLMEIRQKLSVVESQAHIIAGESFIRSLGQFPT